MTIPTLPHVIVLVIDRLGAGWLGPYGTTWIDTPQLNQLAAESLLCEFMLSDSFQLATIYRSYWQGLAAHCTLPTAPWPSLPELAKQAGLQPWLVTDDPSLLELPGAGDFQEQVLLRATPPKKAVRDIAHMQIADLFRTAAEQLQHATQPTLLWLHASAMQSAWDAPYEFCEQFAGEEDPRPPKLCLPPEHVFTTKPDPDELLGYVHSYAGQVVAVDACIGAFREEIANYSPPENTWLIVTSPRGYPLGEHRRVGAIGDALRGELLQVPLIIRMPQQEQQLTRLNSVQQPVDLFATLAGICGTNLPCGLNLRQVAADEIPPSPLAIAWSEHERALRTPAWFYREAGTGDDKQRELYGKPDDRWEVNEIAGRVSEVVAACETVLAELESQRESPLRIKPLLPEVLRRSLA